jgi:hypothetical protein
MPLSEMNHAQWNTLPQEPEAPPNNATSRLHPAFMECEVLSVGRIRELRSARRE